MRSPEHGAAVSAEARSEARRVLGAAVAALGALGLDGEGVMEMVGELLEAKGEDNG